MICVMMTLITYEGRSMKLRKLHIEDYKMFKDFDISFVDENDEVLPIVVLAGVNGSGKTTLLDSLGKTKKERHPLKLENYTTIEVRENDNIEFTYDNLKQDLNLDVPNKFFMLYADSIVYFSAGIDDTKKVADEFVKTFYFFLKEKDYRPSEVKEHFHNYMTNIFDGLEVGFQYSHLDRDDNVWFSNNNGEEFKIEDLSTGEKTLLSKIMYLYFIGYKDKVILIDEPELSLHPSWQNKVLKIYENFALKNNCQIIIATHSPHIIASAKSEYIRLLVKEDDRIKVVDNFTNTYGLKFSQILTEVMGVEHLRPVEVDNQLSKVKSMIVRNEYDSDEFKKEWDELEKLLGKEYLELKLLKVEIASRRKNVSSN
ncbi:MAG: Putative ATP-binding protein [uncultured Sulfurovum sp.]|uniref:ATP-binding protein n=1 Tax=uncultured Sulfurovum sp. TaxID=269237 RepID=A0A6S6TGR5_9BACT|nr:MAG: Putative ATP-binding protein [uncultured Sulfurovum sp.]